MNSVILGAVISGMFAIASVVYIQWNERGRAKQAAAAAKQTEEERKRETVRHNDVELQRIESEAYRRAEASNAESLRIAYGNIQQLERRVVSAEERAAAAEAAARRCSDELEQERRSRRVDAERQAEEVARTIEEERSARRRAEDREAEHAAEVRRLWVIVNALRDAIRKAGVEVSEELLTGGIGTLPDDTAPNNTWSEHSKDQDQE